MLRRAEDFAPARFHDSAALHDDDAPGKRFGDREVVRDERERGARGIDERAQEPHDFRGRKRIERARGLVGDDDAGPQQHGGGNHRALQHAAGELRGSRGKHRLERILGEAKRRERAANHAGERLLRRMRVRNAGRFKELVAELLKRVKSGGALLREVAESGAEKPARAAPVRQDAAPEELNSAARAQALRQEPRGRAEGDRLPGARFADHGERLALGERKRDIRHEGFARAAVFNSKPFDEKERRAALGHGISPFGAGLLP